MLRPNDLLIDDISKVIGNQQQERLQNGQVVPYVVVNGHKRYLSAMPKPAGHDTRLYSKPFSSVFPAIPRNEWRARLQEQIAKKRQISHMQTWQSDDQDGYPICWAAGTVAAFSTARVLQGLPYVRVSGMSVAVPISGGRSGGYEGDAVNYLVKYGGVDSAIWTYDNPRGARSDDPKVQENRKLYLALEAYECETFDDFATAYLLGFACTVAWNFWSHVTMGCDLAEIESGSWGTRIRNNWGEGYGSKNEHGVGGYAVLRSALGPSSGFAFRQVLATAA